MRRHFPHARIVAIDANDRVGGRIAEADDTLFEVLSEQDGREVTFYKTIGGSGTGDSYYRENTQHYAEENHTREVRYTKKLSTLLAELGIQKVDYLKLDTQGSELDILRGMDHYLQDTDFIQMEAAVVNWNEGGCTLDEVLQYLLPQFEIWDVTELHRIYGRDLIQMDFLLKNKKLPLKKSFYW
jgi:FkbM family methyltransferase